MADLAYSTQDLVDLEGSLIIIKTEFDGAEKFSDEVSAAVGNAMLSGKVQDFADQWNDKRAGMAEKVGAMADFVTTIRVAFDKVDAELVLETEG